MLQVAPAYSERQIALREPAVEATVDGARRLGEAYWDEVAAFSHGLVRPRRTADGVELALLRFVVLLRFGRPHAALTDNGVECRYPILGGLLASEPGGFLLLGQRVGETIELSIAVHDYRARLATGGMLGLRRRLFDVLQVPLHEGLSRRFLARAERGPL